VQGENPNGFKARERVVSRVRFKLSDKRSEPLAALYLNWRTEQKFPDKKKKELYLYRKHIFSAIKKLQGISKKRQLWNYAELRSRRWIDYHSTHKRYRDINKLIFESIYHFLDDFDRSELRIEVWAPEEESGRLKIIDKRDYKTPGLVSNDNETHTKWVFDTTRPKFLAGSSNKPYRIVIPIRLLSDLSKCGGVVLIECAFRALVPEMVKPLCYLADHFSRIESEVAS
jgi:hypothetical protein